MKGPYTVSKIAERGLKADCAQAVHRGSLRNIKISILTTIGMFLQRLLAVAEAAVQEQGVSEAGQGGLEVGVGGPAREASGVPTCLP